MKRLDSTQMAALTDAVTEARQKHHEEHSCGSACRTLAALRELESMMIRAGTISVE